MKGSKKVYMIVLFTVVIFGFLFASNGFVSEAASKKLRVKAPKSVAVNCSIQIKTNVKAKFKSSNKKIATVNSKGVVKGKKAGTVRITVTSKSNKKQKKILKIAVKKQLVVMEPDNAKATLYVGEKKRIKTNLSAVYKSSDEKIAIVSKNGTVTAKKAGTAQITVSSKKYKKLKKTVKITVKDKENTTTDTTSTEKAADNTDKDKTEAASEQKSTEAATNKQTSTEEVTPEVLPEAPAFTVDYKNGKTVEAIPDTVEYCVGENAFTNGGSQTIYKGEGNTITVNPGQKIYFRYCATETQKASQIFVLEPRRLQLESIGIATVDCSGKDYSYRYEIRESEDGVKYDFYLSDVKIEDTGTISNANIQTITYKEYDEYYVTSNDYYGYIYVRLAGTEEAFASDWVLAKKIKIDNEFNFDDIP